VVSKVVLLSWVLFFNYLIVLIGLGIVWKIWKLYDLIASPAFLVLGFAFGFLTIYRVALPHFPQFTSWGVALPFYVLAFGSFHYLHRAINKSIHEPAVRDNSPLYHKLKHTWLTKGNVLVGSFMLLVAFVVIYLELIEK
jgi:hypothetical protein